MSYSPRWNIFNRIFDLDTRVTVIDDISNSRALVEIDGGTVATFNSDGLTLASGASINEFSTDGTLAGNSDDAIPTEQAVKTYVDNQFATLASDRIIQDDSKVQVVDDGTTTAYVEVVINAVTVGTWESDGLTLAGGTSINEFSTDGTLSGDSDNAVPTEQAVKTYVDTEIGNISTDQISEGDSYVEVVDTGTGYVTTVVDGSEVIRTNEVSTTFYQDVTVTGDLFVDGTTFVVHNQEVTTADNIIVINDGEVGPGVTAGVAGIEIDRGSETNYRFVFSEDSDTFRIGEIGDTQAVATREDAPVNLRVPWWNDTEKRFDTAGDAYITIDNVLDEVTMASGDSYVRVGDDGTATGYVEIVTDGVQVAYFDPEASTQRIGKTGLFGKLSISDSQAFLTMGDFSPGPPSAFAGITTGGGVNSFVAGIPASFMGFQITDSYYGGDPAVFVDVGFENEVLHLAETYQALGPDYGPGVYLDAEVEDEEQAVLFTPNLDLVLDSGAGPTGQLEFSINNDEYLTIDSGVHYFGNEDVGSYIRVDTGDGENAPGMHLYSADEHVFEASVNDSTFVRVDDNTYIELFPSGGEEYTAIHMYVNNNEVFDAELNNGTYIRSTDEANEIHIQPSGGNIVADIGGTDIVTISSSGLALQSGATVNEFSTDGTLSGDSDSAVPTEQAVKTYVDGAISGAEVDKIYEADSKVEVVDLGFGYITTVVDGVEIGRWDSYQQRTGNEDQSYILVDQTANNIIISEGQADVGTFTEDGLKLENGTFVNEFSTDATLGGYNGAVGSDTTISTEAAVKSYIGGIFSSTSEPTGFADGNDDAVTTLGIDSSNIIYIEPTGASYDIFFSGERWRKTTREDVTLSDVEGMHYVYFDYADGVLKETTTFSTELLTDHVYVSAIYWDATNKEVIYFGDERHGSTMDGKTHLNIHNARGTLYITGLALGDITADSTGSVDIDAQFSVTTGQIIDEDISHTIPSYTLPANIPMFYLSGSSNWRYEAADAFPVVNTGSGRVAWNELSGGTYSLTEATDGYFVLTHVFATNDPNKPVVGIVGQSQYSSLSSARTGASNEINALVHGDMPFEEFLPIATVIYETSDSFVNTPKAIIRTNDEGSEWTDWRMSGLTSGSISVSEHGNLSGLGDDDHLQYFRVDGLRDVTGNLTVNGTTTLESSTSITGGTFTLPNGTSINEFSIDGTLAGNSDDAVPTEKAVKTYVDNKVSPTDRIYEGNSYVEVVDDGTNSGYVTVVTDGVEVAYFDADASTQRIGKASGAGRLEVTDLALYGYVDTRTIFDANADRINLGDSSEAYLTIDQTANTVTISESNVVAATFTEFGLTLTNGTTINEFSVDGTLSGNSDNAVPTEKAVKTYVDDEIAGIRNVRTVSSDTTASDGDILLVDTTAGDVNIELIEENNSQIIVKKITPDGNDVIVSTSPGLIDGQASKTLDVAYQSYMFVSNGSDFFII